MQLSQRPRFSIPAVIEESARQRIVHAMPRGQHHVCCQIALEISACNAQARRQVRVLPDTRIQAQSWDDLRPIRANIFTKLGERVRSRDRRDEEKVDRDFCELGALVAHLKNWTAE